MRRTLKGRIVVFLGPCAAQSLFPVKKDAPFKKGTQHFFFFLRHITIHTIFGNLRINGYEQERKFLVKASKSLVIFNHHY